MREQFEFLMMTVHLHTYSHMMKKKDEEDDQCGVWDLKFISDGKKKAITTK